MEEIRILIFIEAMEIYQWGIKLADSLGNHENQDTSAAKNRYRRVGEISPNLLRGSISYS